MSDRRPHGIILAGGLAQRMGRDKATIQIDGRRLIDRAVGALSPLTDRIVVASGERVIPDLDVPQIADRMRGSGPLGGLIAGLLACATTHTIVLAVDLPEPDPVLLQAMAESWAGQPAIIPSAAGRPQPLHAVWGTRAAGGLAGALAEGQRSVIDAARDIGAVVLSEGETQLFTRSTAWSRNINTPEDLEAFRLGEPDGEV